MNLQRPLFDTDNAAADARAERDFAQGRTVPHEEVSKWLRRRANGEKIPMPAEWFK